MSGPNDLDEAAIRARLEAATPGPWCWRGNIDTGEPYLASRAPGMGASVLAIGTEDRSTTGRRADEVRSYARESDMDPDEAVDDWATDRYGEPIKEPRLWFYTDHMADPARDHVVYEVAPEATSRDDRSVYRADITGIRHPDAEFIAHARTDVERLLEAYGEARAEVQRQRSAMGQWRRLADERAQLLAEAREKCGAAESALTAVRALHRETTMTGVGRACVEGECEHPQCYDGRSLPPEVEFRVCAHCMSLAEETGVTDEWYPAWVMWPCSTIAALSSPTTPTASPVLTTWTAFGGKGWECPKCGGLVAIPKKAGPVACPFGCTAAPTTTESTTEGDTHV